MLNQLRSLSQPQNNNLIDLLNSSNNPQQLMQDLIAQNPQLHQMIMQYGGGNPKAACYEYARLSGQDVNQVLNLLKRYM